MQKRAPLYDKSQEGHYNLISALHKSMRGSDTTRRSIGWRGCWTEAKTRYTSHVGWSAFAVEDVGIADPNALTRPWPRGTSYERLGSPEVSWPSRKRDLPATAPKSIARIRGFESARPRRKNRIVDASQAHPQRTDGLMKHIGYGKDYSTITTRRKDFPVRTIFPRT